MDSKEKEIIARAAEIFSRYGIKSITMDELARQMSVSKKTLYQYFTDKNELVEKVLDSIMAQKQCLMNNIDK
ncbi:MAG: TetR/AcrR family transcriptional regulator, partial [Bacteroidales bacterium]|nr:TetR/AcrR family transcriptional regulator [Bacteroidales bacterium]